MDPAAADLRLKDKVRIIGGSYAGQRGVVEAIGSDTVSIRLRDSLGLITLEPSRIGNFSAAARKAWQTMPRRRVGRPRGQTTDRISVTLRVDRAVWDKFKSLERNGLIRKRSAFLETLLAQELHRLEAQKK